MANECIPLYTPANDVTVKAASGVTGKTFVVLAAGIASRDTATGGVLHLIRSKGAIVPVTAGGTIAVGAEVEVGTNGRAVTLASGKARGRAWSAGTSGNDVFIELY